MVRAIKWVDEVSSRTLFPPNFCSSHSHPLTHPITLSPPHTRILEPSLTCHLHSSQLHSPYTLHASHLYPFTVHPLTSRPPHILHPSHIQFFIPTLTLLPPHTLTPALIPPLPHTSTPSPSSLHPGGRGCSLCDNAGNSGRVQL